MRHMYLLYMVLELYLGYRIKQEKVKANAYLEAVSRSDIEIKDQDGAGT